MIIVSPNFFKTFVKKDFVGIALFPFIIFKNKELLENEIVLNHEKIHLVQQKQMLVIFFYIWYVVEFLIKLTITKNYLLAYRNISFEKEAYINEKNLNYLKNRKFWSFIKYI